MAAVPAKGIGAPVRRVEDERFVTGRGRYVDDIGLPHTVHAFVLRSPHAHASIRSIDVQAANAAAGVLAVLTGEDALREKLGGLVCQLMPSAADTQYRPPPQPVLVLERVRHVGDRVALVVAESAAQARDAAELIEVDYEALPAVTLEDALSPEAGKVWEGAQSNVGFLLEQGSRAAVDQAFARAAHVTRLTLRYPRASANAIEPRSSLAYFDPADRRYTLYSSTQAPFRSREVLSEVLGIPEPTLRVIAPDVGGGFGMKGQVYPEDVLVVWAARKLRRPVKWTGDRSESLASDIHGRDQITEAELALDAEGRALAMRVSVVINLGAYLAYSGGSPPLNAVKCHTSNYDVPLLHTRVRAAFTHSSSIGPYRGSGKPEATYVIERIFDKAAREMGIDPVGLRRRNLIPASAIPYRTHAGLSIDSGDFERVLDKGLELAGWKEFPARRSASEARGLRRGIGLALHCQPAGFGSERMEIRVSRNGAVAVHVGTCATGQGHETMFAQMASQWLGVPFDQISVFQGDTDKVLYGRGTFAQRSAMTGGSALRLAADEVVAKGRRLAAWMLESAVADIEFETGRFRVKGTDRSLGFAEVAKQSYASFGLPGELGVGLDGVGSHGGPQSFPNGCMVCEVEVDPVTGKVEVLNISAVDDVGAAINPLMLEGQLHGSTAQGIGEALLEQIVYERETGQLLTGSFMDYGMPRADHLQSIRSDLHLVPAKTNLLGVKGGSEAGNVGAPAAVINAIVDALFPLGVVDVSLPATPEKIWSALQSSGSS